jgi:hypothetical protein
VSNLKFSIYFVKNQMNSKKTPARRPAHPIAGWKIKVEHAMPARGAEHRGEKQREGGGAVSERRRVVELQLHQISLFIFVKIFIKMNSYYL